MTRTVRTTMQPDRDVEVDDADYLDLLRQGLLVPASTSPAPKDGGGPVGAQADMHIDQVPQQPMAGAADAAALEQDPEPTEPDDQEIAE